MEIGKTLAITLSFFSTLALADTIPNSDPQSFKTLTEIHRALIVETLATARETIKKLQQDEAVQNVDANLQKMQQKIQTTVFDLADGSDGTGCRHDGAENFAYVLPAFFSQELSINVIHVCPVLLKENSSKIFQILLHETAHLAGMTLEPAAVYYEVLVQLLADMPPYMNPVYQRFGQEQRPAMLKWQSMIEAALGQKKLSAAFAAKLTALPSFKAFYEQSRVNSFVERDAADNFVRNKQADCRVFDYDDHIKKWDELFGAKDLNSLQLELSVSDLVRESDTDYAVLKVHGNNIEFHIVCESTNGLFLYEKDIINFVRMYFSGQF